MVSPDLLLVHAMNLGRAYGSQSGVAQIESVSEASLRTLAMRILKAENIGVRREGPRFTVRPECLDAFYAGLHTAAPGLVIRESDDGPELPGVGGQHLDDARRAIERARQADVLRTAAEDDFKHDMDLRRRHADLQRQRIALSL